VDGVERLVGRGYDAADMKNLNLAIAIAQGLVVLGLAFLGVLVSTKPPKTSDEVQVYIVAAVVLAFGGIVLIGWQAYRADLSQKELVTKIDSLQDTVKTRDAEVAKLSKEQLELQRKSLYELAPILVYEPTGHRLLFHNMGKANILLFGTKTGTARVIEKEPRTIPPGTHYYLLTHDLEKEIRKNSPRETRGTFDLYIEDGLGQKHIVKYLLRASVEQDQVVIHTQFVKTEQTDWTLSD
jgi:hypothetical protein